MARRRCASRSVVATLAVVFAAPSAVVAGGINLSWDDCGGFGVVQKSFACVNDAGADFLYVSAIPTTAMSALSGNANVITITTPTTSLPNWWQNQSGTGCRSSQIGVGLIFTGGPFNCRDVWLGNGQGGYVYQYPLGDRPANWARIVTFASLGPFSVPQSVNTTQELYLARIGIGHANSAPGPGRCAGCAESACIILQSVELFEGATVAQTLTTPVLRQHVIWQDPGALTNCPGATPTRNNTWGSVKTLYR